MSKSEALTALRKLVIGLGTMSPDALRQACQRLLDVSHGEPAAQLVIHVIDLYLSVGTQVEARARAAAACLVAIDQLEQTDTSSSSSSLSFSSKGWLGLLLMLLAVGGLVGLSWLLG